MKRAGFSHAGRVTFDTSFGGGPHERAAYARLGLERGFADILPQTVPNCSTS